MNASDFKGSFNLVEFVIKSGQYDPYRGGAFIVCPFHGDSNPSLLVKESRWHCFGCGAHGDSIDFLVRGGYASSVSEAISRYGNSTSGYVPSPSQARVVEYEYPDPTAIERLHRTLLKTPWAMRKLSNRGITIPSMIKYRLGYGMTPRSSCKHPRFSIPFYDKDGKLVTAKFRRDGDSDERDKYLNYYNTRSYLYNTQTCRTAKNIVYCGGQFDSILLEQMNTRAVGPASETMFAEEWASVFEGKPVAVILDNDEAGRAWTGRVCEIVPNSRPVLWPSFVPEGTDVTDAVMLLRGGKEMILDLVNGAVS